MITEALVLYIILRVVAPKKAARLLEWLRRFARRRN
ncbi:MAG: hypothetical protein UW07_C0038G0006 [Candidatus Nomurabacteria bacterium GW2011_GWF2_43_8]|uniref:Uncharacterized protein n=3 Tax=Candidatus Nomuraibacteriota TaxID=1752729 RepID=A0A0G1FK32_9BACT|nr:MAG: hypothetical protein UV76_C0014G0020 [Candidatus Nomurabacteria bacterium GW2011_GWA2_43_15]KKT19597.1 MAG: hypothetical protein UW02_C0007G0006 [Candidatus Nomurabacteria bacterium GW2011_GWB1_43_7]KKT22353.1 MAG: hypothetical protein UW07_C0038G0006 [Candidatus Nomurabacteria bacterium GW2011_GWF2_43_8]